MKIYINNFNLDILNEVSTKLKENLVDTKNFIQLYTDEGIFNIDSKMINKLNPIDISIIIYEKYYKDFTLIADPSYFVKEQISSIHGETHLSFEIQKKYYKINDKSDIYLVIECYIEKSKLITNDIYFELKKDINLNDIFIKKEIIEFLSVLN